MPLRASAPTITMPVHSLSESALHAPSSGRSSTPFPSSPTDEPFEYPFTPTQTPDAQTPPPYPSHALPATSLLPSPGSSPWPSPSALPHAPRSFSGVPGFSPRAGPISPPATHSRGHRTGYAHVTPAQLCAQAGANPPVPPSLAQKRRAVESLSLLENRGTETMSRGGV